MNKTFTVLSVIKAHRAKSISAHHQGDIEKMKDAPIGPQVERRRGDSKGRLIS
jgi:hypothetical protein